MTRRTSRPAVAARQTASGLARKVEKPKVEWSREVRSGIALRLGDSVARAVPPFGCAGGYPPYLGPKVSFLNGLGLAWVWCELVKYLESVCVWQSIQE